MILADLNNQVRKYISNAMLSIEDYRLDVKSGCFKIPPGFFINRFVFVGIFLPVQVLF